MHGERRTLNVERWQAVLLSFFVLGSAFAVFAQQEPAFKSSSSELVVLPVVVTDKQGRYISDLAGSTFAVYDNDHRVPIELFTNEDTPVTVGLIIDASTSMRGRINDVVAASMAFARTSNPQDELFAIRFNDDVQDVMPTRAFLLAGDLVSVETAFRSVRPEGRTALYDGVMEGLDRLTTGTRARKVLVVISDGGDNASDAKLDAVLARARESSAAIYTIGIFDEDDVDKNPGVLKSLARTTGGERYLPRSIAELSKVCERIAREIRGGYTLGYLPPARDGAYHRVRVEIERSSGGRLNVRTRPGYFAGRTQP